VTGAAERRDRRLAWRLLLPAIVVLTTVAVVPLAATIWESLHRHDLRMPWLGFAFVWLANYREAFADPRLLGALGHTVAFAVASVTIEIVAGTALALALDGLVRGRALARVLILMPWALPTVVGALVWRFMFERYGGGAWLSDPIRAWAPIILGDAWKSTPFVALLVLAGLQAIDPALHEAARMDGAGPWRRFRSVTLPLLRPALTVAVVFRMLDAFRVFDFVYVLTGGGPGTATEVLSLYAFTSIFQDLRFGYGSALSVITFCVTGLFALAYIRALAPGREEA
jgi:ABC-type sugar transport system permease subunit